MPLEIDNIFVDEQSVGLNVRVVTLDWGVNGIYGHSGSSYASIPLQVLIPKMADIDGFTKIEAKLCLSYDTEGVATMDAELYDFTDGVSIVGTEKNYPNGTWIYGSTDWIDVTAYEGKAIRVRTKRNGGTGANDVSIEGLVLVLKYS